MKFNSEIALIFLMSASYLPTYGDVIIPAGTTITGLDTNEIDNPGLGISVDQENDIYTFNQDVNCATFTQFITTTSSAGVALTAACNREAGSFLGENADGSIEVGKGDATITIDSDSITVGDSQLLKNNTDGSVQIGADGNDIDITSEGLSIDGNPMITKQSDGNIHIGKNSLITPIEHSTLSDGRKVHHLWAEDDTNTKIPINIHGSDLLINGVSVQGQIDENASNINNLGKGVAGSTALTAALSALPQTSKESKFSCGVGTGAYSSKYALGFGCASKVNERVDINAGGSYVFGGSKSYGGGTLDSGIIKAGFVFKLGELKQSTLISMKDKQKLTNEITDLKSSNKNLNQKISKFEKEKFELLARLERLEKIALSETQSKDLATTKLP